nr:alpha/beta hydrolase [Rhodococcus sp. 14C212]
MSWATVPTESVTVGGVSFAYRAYGPAAGVPVVFLNHLGANLDNWDPRIVDGFAAAHRVIVFDNKGIGASGGRVPETVQEMARDAVAFIVALGLTKVDLFGFSLGGFLAQVIAEEHPELVGKLVLAGTGPAGGKGIVHVARVTYIDTLTAILTRKDPKQNLFFTRTPHGKAQGRAFINRINERTADRDKPVSLTALRTQLRAIHAWGAQAPTDLGRIGRPVFVANGEDDRMVPTSNSYDLARRMPDATLRIYSDAGHGGIFQAHERFVPEALEFLSNRRSRFSIEG